MYMTNNNEKSWGVGRNAPLTVSLLRVTFDEIKWRDAAINRYQKHAMTLVTLILYAMIEVRKNIENNKNPLTS